MTTTEAPPNPQSPIRNPQSAAPVRIALILTPDLRATLLTFLKQTPKGAGLLINRTTEATHITHAERRGLTTTLTIPHPVTNEPLAVQQTRHQIYAGSFWLPESTHLKDAVSKSTAGSYLSLEYHASKTTADLTYTLLGCPARLPIPACTPEKRPAESQHITPATSRHHLLNLPHLHLNAPWFTNLLHRTTPIQALDDSRYVLNGTFLQFDPENPHRLRAAASDGHRLHLEDWTLHPASNPHNRVLTNAILPATATATLLAYLGPAAKPNPRLSGIHLAIEDTFSRLHFHLTHSNSTSITIDIPAVKGTYPNYLAVIPDYTHATRLTLLDPAAAARTATLLGPVPGYNKSPSTQLIVDGSHAFLRGTADTLHPIATVASTSKPIDPTQPLVAQFDTAFLADLLTRTTHLHFTDHETHLVGTAPHITHVLMPLRITK